MILDKWALQPESITRRLQLQYQVYVYNDIFTDQAILGRFLN